MCSRAALSKEVFAKKNIIRSNFRKVDSTKRNGKVVASISLFHISIFRKLLVVKSIYCFERWQQFFFHNGLLVHMYVVLLLIKSNLRSSSAQGSCGHNSKAVFIRDNNFFTNPVPPLPLLNKLLYT